MNNNDIVKFQDAFKLRRMPKSPVAWTAAQAMLF